MRVIIVGDTKSRVITMAVAEVVQNIEADGEAEYIGDYVRADGKGHFSVIDIGGKLYGCDAKDVPLYLKV